MKAVPAKEDVIPMEDREWKCSPSVDEVSTKSLQYSKRITIILLRHSYRLRELDEKVLWTNVMHNFKGFERHVWGRERTPRKIPTGLDKS